MKQIFILQNLKCEGCESSIRKNLLAIEGVKNISLNIPMSELSLTTDTQETLNKVQAKLSQLGYPIVGDRNTVGKKITSFVSCAAGKFNIS